MEKFNHFVIEKDSQLYWQNKNIFYCDLYNKKLKKFYCLEMFPYPSGNLHMGHIRTYTIGDIFARAYRMKGYNVLHPMGFDAFGLPAENAAIQNNLSPKEWTYKNIKNMISNLKSLGISYDWSKQLITSEPKYFVWEQRIFIELYNNGHAYRKKSVVNWDPVDNTVLANEQIIDGKGWRSGAVIQRKYIYQWFLKITDYADELYQMIDSMEWPLTIKKIQKHWINKRLGLQVTLNIQGHNKSISFFTDDPKLVFFASFISISPDHPIAQYAASIDSHINISNVKIDNPFLTSLKTKGVVTLPIVINPFIQDDIQISIPAFNDLDNKVASMLNLDIKQCDNQLTQEQAMQILKTCSKSSINFRLRDWGISRQRKWGAPIPMLICDDCGYQPELISNLPVVDSSIDGVCSKCNKSAKREQDTFDTFIESSYYYIKYLFPDNTDLSVVDKNCIDNWVPVDLYIGGIEHANLHFLYARYFHKLIRDLGYLKSDEPFKKVISQGMILNNGCKMSKSKGNTVSANDIIEKYGADSLRMFIASAAPIENDFEWSEQGIIGNYRLLCKLYYMCIDMVDVKDYKLTNDITQIIINVNKCISNNKINTIIAYVNKLVNMTKKIGISKSLMEIILKILHPFAPHTTCYLYRKYWDSNLNILDTDYPFVDNTVVDRIRIIIKKDQVFFDSLFIDGKILQLHTIEQIVLQKYSQLKNYDMQVLYNSTNKLILNFKQKIC